MVFQQMLERDIIVWNAMIMGLGMIGHEKIAFVLVGQMKNSGVKLNDNTFIGLLCSCTHTSLVNDGRRYFHNMTHVYSISPRIEHYGCMVDLLSRAGLLEEAHQLIGDMPMLANAVVWGARLGGCKIHRNADLAEYVLKQLTRLEPWNSGNYVMLSNIYSNSGRWEDAAKLRLEMKAKGIEKVAASSWVELDDKVHKFYVGDDSHPLSDKIYAKLDELGHGIPSFRSRRFTLANSAVSLPLSARPLSFGCVSQISCLFVALDSSVVRMAAPKPISRLISHVILDLDGTLLNTDSVVSKVVKPFILKNGKTWDSKKAHKLVGKTPYEAAAVVLEDYGLPYSTEEFLSMITPMFRWKESFSAIVGGDEVEKGKPSPNMPGVTGGKAAEMHVIAVPSIPKKTAEFSSADEVINSLLDVRPEKWGLPPFNDWIEGTLPIEPWFIGGPVIKGFGRGSKVLGIPTANLPAENFSDVVSEHTSGVYFGWAGLSTRGIYKMVMSIGWNPYFDNTEKTVEPWLLHNFGEDFYGEEVRLAIVGYIRPEANFPSLESLIERIHEDGRVAEKALDLPMYAKYKDSPYLRNPSKHGSSTTGGTQSEMDSK
ncbi:Haloacid dehalogenase-like hydrolase domain-containing protein 1A isoform 1 [Zea mays]|uniref:riboflavin kinase n=1 Tax=Zea mays TaxID=4577 RepID=A0A1D6LTG2_MAIZE|nr:Haloacid dehalogenase-like hydrolase domain-containing protein 1A isoform 1 [Zea mays]